MTLTPQDQQAIVAAHNAYRSEPAINAPALQWSSELAAGAQSWADHLATTLHKLEHSTSDARGGAGENIAQAPAEGFTLTQMVDFWGKTEIGGSSEQGTFKPGIFPDTSKTGNWADVGHYTQVIWGDTTSVGYGIASDGENSYLVCRYSPAGNMRGVRVPREIVLPFQDQDVITLKADNGYFVTCLTSSDPNWNPIEASVTWAASSTEARAQFTVSILPNKKVAFKANNGLCIYVFVNRRKRALY